MWLSQVAQLSQVAELSQVAQFSQVTRLLQDAAVIRGRGAAGGPCAAVAEPGGSSVTTLSGGLGLRRDNIHVSPGTCGCSPVSSLAHSRELLRLEKTFWITKSTQPCHHVHH